METWAGLGEVGCTVPLGLGLASAHTQLLASISWMGLCRDCIEGKASEVYQPERHESG